MHKFYLCFVLLVSISLDLIAQYTGVVVDQDGEPLPFASVHSPRYGVGTSTNSDGVFQLAEFGINECDSVWVSYVGFNKGRHLICKNQADTLQLIQSYTQLSEVLITLEQLLPAREYVQQAVRNLKKNYISGGGKRAAFYQELVYENAVCVQQNEALVLVNCDGYPSRNRTKSAFRKYWRDGQTMTFGVEQGDVFRHSQYFPYFVNPNESAYLVETRLSANWSKYARNPNPFGGPLDLLAVDKLKYAYDFFDPKLVDSYQYEISHSFKEGDKEFLVITFRPLGVDSILLAHPLNKKMDSPIFTGNITINLLDYSVKSFACQFAPSADFSIYAKSPYLPQLTKLYVSYSDDSDKKKLEKVEVIQLNSRNYDGVYVPFECKRRLIFIEDSIEKDIGELIQIPLSHSSTLRNHKTPYDNSIWATLKKHPNYPVVASSDLSQLSSNMPLENQYEMANLKFDSKAFPDPWNRTVESYQDYAIRESAFEQKFMVDNTVARRQFYQEYLNMTYSPNLEYQTAPGEIQVAKNKKGELWFVEKQESPKQDIELANYDTLRKDLQNFHVTNIKRLCDTLVGIQYSAEGTLAHNLVIRDFAQGVNLCELDSVSEFRIFNDNVVVIRQASDLRSAYIDVLKLDRVSSNLIRVYSELNESIDLTFAGYAKDNKLLLSRSGISEHGAMLIRADHDSIQVEQILPIEETSHQSLFLDTNQVIYSRYDPTDKGYELWIMQLINGQHLKLAELGSGQIHSIERTKDYILVSEFHELSVRIRVINLSNSDNWIVNDSQIADPVYVQTIDEIDFDRNTIVITTESPSIPRSTIRYQLAVKESQLIKQDRFAEIKNSTMTVTELIFVEVDSVKVPITILRPANKPEGGYKGMIAQTYAAYGSTRYPYFDEHNLTYARLGYVHAFVHARGGSEMGVQWHQSGRGLKKLNSMSDYVAAIKHLQTVFAIAPSKTIGVGESAGGLLVSMSANSYPQLFGGIILDKPFIDVYGTVQRNQDPLVEMEVSEWGDIRERNVLEYIYNYSPLQNLSIHNDYPSTYLLAKSNDVQAPPKQIVEYLAARRKIERDDTLIILNYKLGQGHLGATNMDEEIDLLANKFAFVEYVVNRSIDEK